jgi:hypothetical protein
MDLAEHAGGLSVSAADPAERATAVDSEGWLYDVVTGEVLGHPHAPEAFTIDSDLAAEWALELRSKIEGDIAAVEARIRALTAQLDAIRATHVRRLGWWDWRFHSQLVAYARSKLGTARTWRCAWGKVAFRRLPPASEIVDMPAAVAWCEAWMPDLVHRPAPRVTVSAAVAAVEAAALATGDRERPSFLVSSLPGESVTVSTGVELNGKGARR